MRIIIDRGVAPIKYFLFFFFMIFRNQYVNESKMKDADELVITGIQSTNMLGEISLIQSCLNVERLLQLLPLEHLMWDRFSTSYERSVNRSRLSSLQNHFNKSVVGNVPFESPLISLVLYGKVRLEKVNNNVVSLKYEKNHSAIVGGFLAISALSNLLGRQDPFTKKTDESCSLTLEQKQILKSVDVRLSIYVGQDRHLNEEELANLFFSINSLDTRVYSQYISTHIQESPLNHGATRLANILNLDALGGVSELNKLTKSDSFVTTRSTLIAILLATMGGKSARVEKQLPTHLPDKSLITPQSVERALELVTPLMEGWLSSLDSEFRLGRNGFHRSMQTWQALGVVAFYLSKDKEVTESKLYSVGKLLGDLDYDKGARHWEKCDAFKRDISGSFWINATGGGRTFRNKLADYFMDVLRNH